LTAELLLLCLVAFSAGFIDAIAGGGGLLQTPAVLLLLPQYPVATLLGTVKIPSFCGTAVSAITFSKKVKFQFGLLIPMALTAFLGAFLGAWSVSIIPNSTIKPIILIVLILVAAYTFIKPAFGAKVHRYEGGIFKPALAGMLIGFYDGLIGPGTGSFLLLLFISLLGMDFLHASAHAKIVNLGTNLAAIFYFGYAGHILFSIAIPMAICNMLGGYFGASITLLKGNSLVKWVFRVVIIGTIIRLGWDVFFL
jgi:uncharacterized membrane protein YfcA